MMVSNNRSEMGADRVESADDIPFEGENKYKIAVWQTLAIEAEKKGRYDAAEEFYNEAINDIEDYRAHLYDLKQRATLDEEDRQNLREIERELDNIEEGIQDQLESIS